jgi:hypothetical protein
MRPFGKLRSLRKESAGISQIIHDEFRRIESENPL